MNALWCGTKSDLRYLAMHCQEEWPILDTIKVHAIEATREIERAHERSLVGEQSAVDEIRGCTVLWQKSN